MNRNVVTEVLIAGTILVGGRASATYRVLPIVAPAGYAIGAVAAINNSGQVAGDVALGTNPGQAVLWTPSADGQSWQMQLLPFLKKSSGPGSDAYGINDAGAVAGDYASSGHTPLAVYWPTPNSIVQMSGFGNTSYAKDVNNAGEVVGWGYYGVFGAEHAYLYKNGKTYDLTTALGQSESWALAINNSGKILGIDYRPGNVNPNFLWTPNTPNGTAGAPTYLSPDFSALALNDLDGIVGYQSAPYNLVASTDTETGTSQHPFQWDWPSNAAIALQLPSDWWTGEALALNGASTPAIVGYGDPAYVDSSTGLWTDVGARALLWQNGSVVDLNGALDPSLATSAGWVLQKAVGVNDNGWILCNGTQNGVTAACVLIPE